MILIPSFLQHSYHACSLSKLHALLMANTPHPDFHLFSKLPLEIRRMIWVHSLPGPRIVDLRFSNLGPRRGFPNKWQLISPTEIPIALHVCKESREEAKRYYKLTFDYDGREPHVYFDFSMDTVHLPGDEKSGAIWNFWDSKIGGGGNFDKIKRMRVSCHSVSTNSPIPKFLAFKGLKKLWVDFDPPASSENSRAKRDELFRAFEATRRSLTYHYWEFPTLVLSDGRETETYIWPELAVPDDS